MPTYEIQAPNGQIYEVDGPRPPTRADIQKMQTRGVFGASGEPAEPEQAGGLFTSAPATGREVMHELRGHDYMPGVSEGARSAIGVGVTLASGAPGIARAVSTKGAPLAARAAQGVRATASAAAPLMQYEVVKRGLMMTGLPEPVAGVIAAAMSVRRSSAPASAPTSAAPAPTPAPQPVQAPATVPARVTGPSTVPARVVGAPARTPAPAPPVMPATAPPRAEMPPPASPAPRPAPVAGSAKTWTQDEVNEIVRLKGAGYSHDAAIDRVIGARSSASPVSPAASTRAASAPATPAPSRAVDPTPTAASPAQTPPSVPRQAWSPQRIQNEIGIQNRRLKTNLSEGEYAEAATLVKAGRSPAEAVTEVASRRPAPATTPQSAAPTTARSAAEKRPSQGLVEESPEYLTLRRAGKSHEEAIAALQQQRAFAEAFGTTSPSTARRRVAERNATGRWPKDEQ